MELRASKTMGMVAQGACRSLVIYRCELGDQGVYVCEAHDAQSSASLKVQGEGWAGGCKDLLAPTAFPSKCLALWFCPCAQPVPRQQAGPGVVVVRWEVCASG